MEKDNWFKIMWGNGYIQLSAIAITFMIINLCYLNEYVTEVLNADNYGIVVLITVTFLIPFIILPLTVWLGFIKHWNKLKKLEKEKEVDYLIKEIDFLIYKKGGKNEL